VSEFKLINQFINRVKTDDTVALGIGDDAAVLNVPEGFQIVQTMDTMVMGVHFDERFSADALAHKLLHVNLSDAAAMGASPKWATVALTMPSDSSNEKTGQDFGEQWLDEFSKGLQSRSAEIGLNLVGGDTTSGPLSLTMNLTAIVKTNEYITRSGAQVGDDVYVSGYLGDAALALTDQGAKNTDLVKRLLYPQSRLELGSELYGIANACLDISDGLLADLGHICDQSDVSAQIDVENLVLSKAYQDYFSGEFNPDFALNGGDDYELCFTANTSQRAVIQALSSRFSKKIDCPITRIGRIVTDSKSSSERSEQGVTTLLNGQPYSCQRVGWQHFA
jgi:thiamine-monophosphate kinase